MAAIRQIKPKGADKMTEQHFLWLFGIHILGLWVFLFYVIRFKKRLRCLGYPLVPFAVVIWMPHTAMSAEFKKLPGTPDLIEVVGDLVVGDEKRFIDVAIGSTDAVVVFHSPGGNLIAGMEIGKAIRLKGFTTLVPDRMLCASACALAWLGGRVRLMSDSGRVGFHAAYTDRNGQANVSSVGNAVVGAFLNQLGLPTSAIIYITGSPPDGMQWLSFADARQVGIDVKQLNLTASVPAAPKTPEPTGAKRDTNLRVDSIEKETRDFIAASNRPNAETLAFLQNKYTEQVSYFGKMQSRSEVLKDKKAFFNKWPRRTYVVKPDTLRIDCSAETVCKSEGVVNWMVSGTKSESLGSATFALAWTIDQGNWKLSAEAGQVISRKVSRIAPDAPPSELPKP